MIIYSEEELTLQNIIRSAIRDVSNSKKKSIAKILIPELQLLPLSEFSVDDLNIGEISILQRIDVVLVTNLTDVTELVHSLYEVTNCTLVACFGVFEGLDYTARELNECCHGLFLYGDQFEVSIYVCEAGEVSASEVLNLPPSRSKTTERVRVGLVLEKWTKQGNFDFITVN